MVERGAGGLDGSDQLRDSRYLYFTCVSPIVVDT